MSVTLDMFEYGPSDAAAQAAYVSSHGAQTSLQLWSKLGAAGDITSPQLGNGGVVVGSPTYPACKFGNGILSDANDEYAKFPRVANSINNTKGTIECWLKFLFATTDTDYHVIWGFQGAGAGFTGVELIFFPTDDKIHAYVSENGVEKVNISLDFSWNINDIVHFAITWDKDGNDIGDSKTVMAKVGNVEKASSTNTWGVTGSMNANLYVGIGRTEAANHSDVVIDNLKTYDVCKTDFSDKDVETGYALECYSEDTIKQQGSYSLKGIGEITSSLNETLTRTVAPTIDLSGEVLGQFRIRASRTGGHIKIGIHDSGGVPTETTPNIVSINTWQTVEFGLPITANKDAIDQIIITIVNADSDNTFYLDWFITTNTMTVEEALALLETLPTITRQLTVEEAIALNETITSIPVGADVVLETAIALAESFPAGEQTIVSVEPSAEFLAEQEKRSNMPAKRIWLFINSTLYDITDKFMTMGPIDRKMTYKPGETKLLTISDQDLVMTNADQYFSDLNPSSPFYGRDYAGVDTIKVYAGFIIPSTGYAEVLQKADMRLIAIELMTTEGHAHLRCQDSFREVFDIYIGMPDDVGDPVPQVYDGMRFKDIMEDLLIDKAGIGYPEKVTDTGIENWDNNTPDDWTEDGEMGGVRDITNEAAEIHWGGHAVKFEATNAGGVTFEITQDITLVAGVQYEFRCWIDFPVRTAGSINIKVRNGVDGDMAVTTLAVTHSGYQLFTALFTPTQVANVVHLQFLNETVTGIAYFDDVSVKQVGTRVDIEDVDLSFGALSYTETKVVTAIQQLSEVARGNTVVLDDGTVQFRRFVSEVTAVDLVMRSGESYSRLRYVGQDFLLKVNKVVVIGAGGAAAVYAEAEIAGDTGITLVYNNVAILNQPVAADVASECLGRFAVHPALVEVTGEYLPSLDLKSVIKLYEPNSLMNPLIFQVREIALDIVRHKTRMLLSIPDSAGRSHVWTTKADWDDYEASDGNLYCPSMQGLKQLELAYDELTGTSEYKYDAGAGRTANWVYFNASEENAKTIWRDDFRADSLARYTLETMYGAWGYTAPSYDAAGKRILFDTGDDKSFSMRLPVSVQNFILTYKSRGYFKHGTNFGFLSMGRWVNNSNMYMAIMNDTGSPFASAIGKVVATAWTDLKTGAVYHTIMASSQTLITTFNGNSLKAELVGIGSLSVSNAVFPNAGPVKIGAYQGKGNISWLLLEHYALPSPANTTYTFRFNTSDDDMAWDGWVDDIEDCPNSRYIKVEVTLARVNLDSAMPVLEDMTVGYFLAG